MPLGGGGSGTILRPTSLYERRLTFMYNYTALGKGGLASRVSGWTGLSASCRRRRSGQGAGGL